MDRTPDELLSRPYWVIDFLPEQVRADSPGQYFAVEEYFLEEGRLREIKNKHIRVLLKLACYRRITLDGAVPSPEELAGAVLRRYVDLLTDGAMITSAPDDLHMTVYDPDETLLELLRALAAGEGLYVWQPPRD